MKHNREDNKFDAAIGAIHNVKIALWILSEFLTKKFQLKSFIK
jgi:hypothetical protein